LRIGDDRRGSDRLHVFGMPGRHNVLYYYIFVPSRAATILLWGRMASCGRLVIGQMPLTMMRREFPTAGARRLPIGGRLATCPTALAIRNG
jgi:hypothetical protein